jgi:hypothetical protein
MSLSDRQTSYYKRLSLTSLKRMIVDAQRKGEKNRAQELFTAYARKGGKLTFGQVVNRKPRSFFK